MQSLLLISLAASVMASPTKLTTRQTTTPEIYLTIFDQLSCEQIEDASANAIPNAYTVTAGPCINGAYTFYSLAETTTVDFGATQCALKTYGQPNCAGFGYQASLTKIPRIMCQNLTVPAVSFQLTCP